MVVSVTMPPEQERLTSHVHGFPFVDPPHDSVAQRHHRVKIDEKRTRLVLIPSQGKLERHCDPMTPPEVQIFPINSQ
jgi:hypothetical protein